MNLSSNIKDRLSTIFGILGIIAGAIQTAIQSGTVFPTWVAPLCQGIIALSILVIGYLTGKTPAANSKTPDHVIDQNKPEPIK